VVPEVLLRLLVDVVVVDPVLLVVVDAVLAPASTIGPPLPVDDEAFDVLGLLVDGLLVPPLVAEPLPLLLEDDTPVEARPLPLVVELPSPGRPLSPGGVADVPHASGIATDSEIARMCG
jgi:hypothetical protein